MYERASDAYGDKGQPLSLISDRSPATCKRWGEATKVALGVVEGLAERRIVAREGALERLGDVEAIAGDEGQRDVERRQLALGCQLCVERRDVRVRPQPNIAHKYLQYFTPRQQFMQRMRKR
jgi:hypothetical protein